MKPKRITNQTVCAALLIALMNSVSCDKKTPADQAKSSAPLPSVTASTIVSAPVLMDAGADGDIDAGAPVLLHPRKDDPSITHAMLDQIIDRASISDAIGTAKPTMKDSTEGVSVGAWMLTLWGIKRGVWSDFWVSKSETNPALVLKDSESERTKKMCRGGNVDQIEIEKTSEGNAYSGVMLTNTNDLVWFLAVGSTEGIVQRTHAKFCGIVTGAHSYTGIDNHNYTAVQVVGMFDIPQNRKSGAK